MISEIEVELAHCWIFDMKGFFAKIRPFKDPEGLPMCEGILKMHEYLKDGKDLEELVSYVQDVAILPNYPVLSFFFYFHWFLVDARCNRLDEAQIIVNKLESLIDSESPVAVKAEYLLCKAQLAESHIADRIYKEGLSLLPVDSYRYILGSKTVMDEYSQGGRIIDVEPKYSKVVPKDFLNIFHFIDAVETGQIEKALHLKSEIVMDVERIPGPARVRLQNSLGCLDLYLGKIEADSENEWLKPIKMLMKKDLPQALTEAKIFYDKFDSHHASITSIGRVALLRAHLANSNIEGASSILEKWSIENRVYFFVDFFYARLELLKNDLNSASYYFSKLLEVCKKYNAFGRLDFELDLALEVKAHQIRFLMSECANKDISSQLKKQLSNKNIFDKKETGITRLIGVSESVVAIKEEVLKYSALEIPVLVLGETGVGKDVVANAIHEESSRKEEPFLAINCSSIAENLLQSELFGHEAGAYTGASKAHKGVFQEAGKGTVFLDEIGDISSGLQAALLRVLESGECRPVGSAKAKPVFCRIIAATNADLEKKVAEGSFRLDLFYRLKRLVIEVPPLRMRKMDIPFLVDYFLNLKRVDKVKSACEPEMIKALVDYDWPGNVRELKNEMEKMRLLSSDTNLYKLEDIKFLLNKKPAPVSKLPPNKEPPHKNVVEQNKNLDVESLSSIDILENSDSYFRRIEKIKKLFVEFKKLSRKEIFKITKIPNLTLGRDLKALREEKFILKIEPTKSPRTHYFELIEKPSLDAEVFHV